MNRIAKIITVIVAIFTVLCLGLLLWSRSVALPTKGGISPHEVVEGLIPGGVGTLLTLWIGLVLVAASIYVWYAFLWFRGKKESQYHE
jgi:hypothetical protein